jgi:hypothetical protein
MHAENSGRRVQPRGGGQHGARAFDAERHDPYQSAGKYREPTQCEDCGAVFHRGRWAWGAAPAKAEAALCPACRRIRDKLPAGRLAIEGAFFAAHRDDLLHLVRNEAALEGREHPLHRLMRVDETADHVEITTTDIHLPRRIGDALRNAYDGELDIRYGENEYMVRVRWRR